jgi:hypothetical protein
VSAASIQQSSIALLMLIGAALNGGLEFAGVVAVWFAPLILASAERASL